MQELTDYFIRCLQCMNYNNHLIHWCNFIINRNLACWWKTNVDPDQVATSDLCNNSY